MTVSDITILMALLFSGALSECISGVSHQKPTHSSCLPPSNLLQQVIPMDTTEITAAHNFWRSSSKLNPMPVQPLTPLKWNRDLAETAQGYASQCTWGHDKSAARNVPAKGWSWVGQNLHAGSANSPLSSMVNSWGDEIENWVYGVGAVPSNAVVGHYTQIIWNTTLYVGCGAAKCSNLVGLSSVFKYIFVCNYGPGGNINGYAYPYYSENYRSNAFRPTMPHGQQILAVTFILHVVLDGFLRISEHF